MYLITQSGVAVLDRLLRYVNVLIVHDVCPWWIVKRGGSEMAELEGTLLPASGRKEQ